MKKNHCSAECKQQAVCRFTEGKDLVSTIAEDLGIAVCSLRDWNKQVKMRENLFSSRGAFQESANLVHRREGRRRLRPWRNLISLRASQSLHCC